MKLRSLAVAAALAAAAVLPAQTAAQSPAPHIVFDTVGPDGWRLRLGPTNLGGLLESERGRQLWEPQTLPLLGFWQQLVGGEAEFAAAKARLLGYGGRVRLAIWLQDDDLDSGGVRQMALVLEGDGRTDIKALAADVRQLQQQVPGEWGEQDVGGAKLEVVTQGPDAMTGPVVVGDHVVLAMARDGQLAAALADGRALVAGATGKPPAPTTPALRVDVDVAAIVAMAKAQGEAEANAVMDALGLGSLGRVQMSIATAGPHVMAEIAQTFTPAPRGLFAAFFPPAQQLPTLQRAVPAKAASWRSGHFDFTALHDAVVAALDASGFTGGTDVAAEMKEDLGLDLRQDVLAHMTTEMLFTGSPLQGLDRPSQFTWSFAAKLRDSAAFAKGLATLLTKSKPFLSREATTTVDGVEVQRFGNMFGYDLLVAVGNGTFLFGGGRDIEEQFAALLAATKPAGDAAVVPAHVANVLAGLGKAVPPGLNGQAQGDLDSLFAVPLEWWLMPFENMLPIPIAAEDDPDAREATRELLKAHNLGSVRTATGYAESVWRWRLYW